MNKWVLVLCIFFLFANCKAKKKEFTIKSEFKNSKISFDFFCSPSESRDLMYYEVNMEKNEYLPVFRCEAYESIYQLLIQNVTLDNGVWLTLAELSCINDRCVVKEKPSEHLMGEPDGELKFQVINKDVVKLISSNVRQLGYQDSDVGIPYKKAEDFFDLKRNIYIFKRPSELKNCPMSRILVDTIGDKGVSCGEPAPEINESPADEEPTSN
ncbi:hypothetical protein EHQ68_00485 [Leptospira congkakensis]|uniref:Uncharacterized protein n=1 Tax=Leptospira congkakensis TaxID=2484932 RepID=A0A4Z1AC72_9LEPT|nr:hypothetical protein [Leptospira congkakensis]TGL87872.1 hypothetical protein EHQ69_17420 [Leptospira congkakensis]TGL92649.1 hypothetical protein EHQ68_00485 [Leptospira congkakensis]TGL96022.1 hypothetical protein EHQ70_13090 [Leptospira congkakensis]